MPRTHARDLPRMTIGVLSQAVDCKPETIRYYERIGLLPPPPRTRGGHRMYATADARRLAFIRRGRDLGFSLEEVRELLTLAQEGAQSCAEVRQMTLAHAGEIRRKIRELGGLARELERAADKCEGVGGQGCAIVDALYPKDG